MKNQSEVENFQLNIGSSSSDEESDLLPEQLSEQLKHEIQKCWHDLKPISILARTNNSLIVLCRKQDQSLILKLGQRSLIEKETRIVQQCEHPHIVKIFEFRDGGILMPKYQGNLRSLIYQKKLMSPDLIKTFLMDIGSALQCLHKQQIVHGDMNSTNVLFKQEKQTSFFLTDFGNSFYMADENYPTQTQTLPYRAPESFYGQMSTKIDIWGLGCILFQCLTGQSLLPFQTDSSNYFDYLESYASVSQRKLRMERFCLKQNKEKYQPLIVGHLLQKDPKKRMTAHELVDYVRNL